MLRTPIFSMCLTKPLSEERDRERGRDKDLQRQRERERERYRDLERERERERERWSMMKCKLVVSQVKWNFTSLRDARLEFFDSRDSLNVQLTCFVRVRSSGSRDYLSYCYREQ